MRHAYLIATHGNFKILNKLVKQLDNKNNDIFIHVDKKISLNKNLTFQTKNSRVTFVKQIKVNWGGYSQIKCELILLKEALKGKYDYYHFISGVDFPLKRQQEILDYYEQNKKLNFFHININQTNKKNFYDRIQYYYLFQDNLVRGKSSVFNKLKDNIQEYTVILQRKFKINRIDSKLKIYKGGNWFDITHELASYIVENEKWIKKNFRFTYCADEIFLPTLCMNSPYADTCVGYDNRMVDWKRGTPYIFRSEDFALLMSCECLFARKFDENIDFNIVLMLENYFNKE